MVTELVRLSTTERMAITDAICRAVESRAPVVIGVGAESTHCAVELARHAEGAGAAVVMATPPIGIAPTTDALLHYFERLLQAVAIPLIVQDASGYVGRPIGTANMARLQAKFGSERLMFKPEAPPLGPQLTDLSEATSGAAKVFEGSGGIALVDCYRRGIVGTMPGSGVLQFLTTPPGRTRT